MLKETWFACNDWKKMKNFNLREVLLLRPFKLGSKGMHLLWMLWIIDYSCFYGFTFKDWKVKPWKCENDFSKLLLMNNFDVAFVEIANLYSYTFQYLQYHFVNVYHSLFRRAGNLIYLSFKPRKENFRIWHQQRLERIRNINFWREPTRSIWQHSKYVWGNSLPVIWVIPFILCIKCFSALKTIICIC